MSAARTGLVVGYGSVGKRHARTLASQTPQLAIVEIAAQARQQAQLDHPEALVVAGLDELTSLDWQHVVAVVASWGPGHAAHMHALADLGVTRILVEKPMAASVQEAQGMAERAERESIRLAVHHFIRYAGLAPALHALFAHYELGPAVGLVVQGGAACLVTNGIHWLDFAAELFAAAPQAVMSSAVGASINPRAPDLFLYGGSAVWSFGAGREAVISLSNHSSIALSAQVYLRDAVAEISGDLAVTLRRRDRAMVAQFPKISRTGQADELLFKGVPPGVLSYGEGMSSAIAEVAGAGELRCPAPLGVTAVSACIGALAAARARRTIDLPIDPASDLGQEHWPIS